MTKPMAVEIGQRWRYTITGSVYTVRNLSRDEDEGPLWADFDPGRGCCLVSVILTHEHWIFEVAK